MNVKVFVYSSLALLGVWLAAAYMYTVDVASYTGVEPAPATVETELPTSDTESAPTLVAAQ